MTFITYSGCGHLVSSVLAVLALCVITGRDRGRELFHNNEDAGLQVAVDAAVDTAAVDSVWFEAEAEESVENAAGAIMERLKFIYGEIAKAEEPMDFDTLFLTDGFNELLKEERAVTPEGEVGYIDSDHWTQSQDPEKPSFDVLSINIVSDTEAEASVRIMPNCETDYTTVVRIKLLYERGDWYVDDFITDIDGEKVSERQGITDYIASVRNLADDGKVE